MLDPIDLIRMSSSAKELLAGRNHAENSEDDSPALHGLDLLVVFSGYLDAGNVSTQLGNVLLERLDHQRIATFDTDQLLDYRARRPHLRFDGQRFSDYEAPELELHLLKDQMQRPFLLLSGPEPDYQWDRFVSAVMILIEQLDIHLVTFVDAVPLPVPHTRPLGVTTHGTAQELLEGLATWAPKGRIAAGAAQLFELRAAEAGRRVSGYTLHVPHYLADATYPQAAVAALEYIGAAMGLMLPTEELRESGREVEQQLAAQVQNRPDIAAMLQHLEQRFDEHAEEHQARSLLLAPDQQMPDAEEIGSAVESYLSDQVQHDDAGLDDDDRRTIADTGQIDESPTDPMRPSRSEVGPGSVEFITDFYDPSQEDDEPEGDDEPK
ncbi:PAC2 family protein [Enteractinococcus coprophilus]|uniref:PAC2 family protein n=1 Tax=Enteractinococcus coprophilus TaxID=1027633 RepID=A0A543AJN3_9MICC|nr:PAC2 family protein [Enteractinococcus coprophilus]TQL72808.1 PAC2 family protein [Enteractinococcus coprophilus]